MQKIEKQLCFFLKSIFDFSDDYISLYNSHWED